MARWSNLEDTASYFATTPRQLRSMVFDGRLPKRKIGGRLIFDLDEIEAIVRPEPAKRAKRSAA